MDISSEILIIIVQRYLKLRKDILINL